MNIWLAKRADGSWPDIDYNNRSVNWDPQKHLDRLAAMAVGYCNGKSEDHNSTAMLQALTRGLVFWYHRRPQSDSWWSNGIGQQLALEQILVLLDGSLPANIIAEGASFLHDPVQAADLKPSGQNLIWFAGEQFVRGALTRSPQDILYGLTVAVDNPCMMLIEEKGSSDKIGVSAPRGPLDIHVVLNTPRGRKDAVFSTRGGPYLGATILQNIVF